VRWISRAPSSCRSDLGVSGRQLGLSSQPSGGQELHFRTQRRSLRGSRNGGNVLARSICPCATARFSGPDGSVWRPWRMPLVRSSSRTTRRCCQTRSLVPLVMLLSACCRRVGSYRFLHCQSVDQGHDITDVKLTYSIKFHFVGCLWLGLGKLHVRR